MCGSRHQQPRRARVGNDRSRYLNRPDGTTSARVATPTSALFVPRERQLPPQVALHSITITGSPECRIAIAVLIGTPNAKVEATWESDRTLGRSPPNREVARYQEPLARILPFAIETVESRLGVEIGKSPRPEVSDCLTLILSTA
jgi:hypothetical protein